MQRLVFLGRHRDEEAICARLDACLVADDRALGGVATGSFSPGPFPPLGSN